MRLIRWVPVSFIVGLVAACGGSSKGVFEDVTDGGADNDGGTAGSAGSGGSASGSGGAGDDTGIPLEEIPGKYAAAICATYTTCLGDLFAIFRPGEDCLKNTTVQLQEELAKLGAIVDAGRIEYDGTKLQACLDAVAGGDCSALSQRAPESCEAALQGTVAEGGACELDEECKGLQYCKVDGTCPGTCTLLEQAGGVCSGNNDCVSGLMCGETGRCVAPAKAGEACKQGEPDCMAGYLCLGEDAAAKTPGKCFEVRSTFSGQAGDECSVATKLCASGLACEITKALPIGGTCAAVVGSGETCRAAFPDECPADEFCKLGTNLLDPYEGKCTTKPGPGEPCGKGIGSSPDQCAPYARCDGGVCREIAHLGESCTEGPTCYSDRCVNGACVAANSCE